MMIEMLIPAWWEFLLLLFVLLESNLFGYVFVYNDHIRLSQIEAFNIYPYVCQKCFSFWLCFIQNILLAYMLNPMFVLWGLITSSILAYMIWYSNEKPIK